VKKKIERNYLEINSIKDLKEKNFKSETYNVSLVSPPDFQINKFFYKNIGKNHKWLDRLEWSEKKWIEYISNKTVKTYILKKNIDYLGYYELIFHTEKKETEIAYLGLLEEYQNNKLGSCLLSSAIKNSFLKNSKRVWVHTCSLDHKNALRNYLLRGMKIFKKETILV